MLKTVKQIILTIALIASVLVMASAWYTILAMALLVVAFYTSRVILGTKELLRELDSTPIREYRV